MIRIRFFGPQELIQNGFRAGQYGLEDLSFSPAAHGGDVDESASQSSTGNAAIFLLVEKSHGPGRSRQYPLGPWRVPFSKGFHGLNWPPQEVRGSPGTTSRRPQSNFSSSRSRPGLDTAVIPNLLRTLFSLLEQVYSQLCAEA